MTLATRIAGVVNALREVVNTAQTRRDGLHLEFRELRCLVKEYDVILHALQTIQVLVAVAVGEIDG